MENCLLHGLGQEGQGLIIIKAYRVEEDLKIIVTDTGVGINDDTLNNLMRESHHQTTKMDLVGLAFENVDERIKLYFGETYGLAIQSIPNLYTTVEITLPAVGERRISENMLKVLYSR